MQKYCTRIIIYMRKIFSVSLFFVLGFLLFSSKVLAQSCSCPTSSLTVDPQTVQPGGLITLTFPWDRANFIEDNTNGGLQQESGHVDNTNGGSIHFQNGSNNWYTFHAGPNCGTYTWNHQSRPNANCNYCYVSTKFNVCGVKEETAAIPPTLEPSMPVPTATSVPTISQSQPSIPTVTGVVLPTSSSLVPTVIYQGSGDFKTPTTSTRQSDNVQTNSNFNFTGYDFMGKIFLPFQNLGKSLISGSKNIIEDIFIQFLKETNF